MRVIGGAKETMKMMMKILIVKSPSKKVER